MRKGDSVIPKMPFQHPFPSRHRGLTGFRNQRMGNDTMNKSKLILSVMAQGLPFSRSGRPYPEVLVPVLAQFHVGVAAQRLQEATGHSAEMWTRTPPLREQ